MIHHTSLGEIQKINSVIANNILFQGREYDKEARIEANKKINENNYFEMKKPTDPPFKVRKFENVKSWVDYILGAKEESKDEK